MHKMKQQCSCGNLVNHLRGGLRESIACQMSDTVKSFLALLHDSKVNVMLNCVVWKSIGP